MGGVGLAIAISTGTASLLSFLVFWLVLGEKLKEHVIDGTEVIIAPVYLVCVLLGRVQIRLLEERVSLRILHEWSEHRMRSSDSSLRVLLAYFRRSSLVL